MRYAVYITRAEHWSFEARERQPISEREWLAYAQRDAELQPLHVMPAQDLTTGAVTYLPAEKGYWTWIAHPDEARPLSSRTFEYHRGGIIVRAPDSALLTKALAIANTFGARVIADDDQVIQGIDQ